MRGSSMQWPFSNKVSALPQFMPFRQEERPKKMVIDPLASSGFMPISTADAFDANQKAFASVVQKNFNLDRHGGNHYAMTAYPVQHVDAYSTHRPNEIRTFSVSNHTISVAMSNPFFKGHVSTAGHPLAASNLKQQPLGGIPVMASHLPTAGSMAGSADQRNMSKPAGAPAQLTIFYGGSVNVYDDVSPEKAQAIMFLAGNGTSANPNIAAPRAQVQAPIPKTVGADVVHGNQSHSTSPCSGLSSPISVTSHPGAQSASGCSGTDELMAAKSKGPLVPPSSQPEPSKVLTSLGTAATLMPAAVPQARKASLARFLEKRKERVMHAAPYSNMSKQSPESSTTQGGSNSFDFTRNSGAGSVPNNKEQSWCLAKTKTEIIDGDLQKIN
ncbi:Tify [Macleaya cordata]|uniref:Protein TIFY n=1 Tax=Macleaya cordata TaxID=56857 RepID=A0A200QL89_MACCD|nr:Tify [Macleaya cordata]